VFLTAEEKGLLGSDYFARYPAKAAGTIVADVNLDMPVFMTASKDIVAFGAENSTLDAVVKLARTEGILPALESAHAIAECLRIAPSFSPRDILIVNLSGRGDKDMGIIARELKIQGA